MSPTTSSLDSRLGTWLMRRTAPSGARRMQALSAAIATDVGLVRQENQDRVAVARGVDAYGREYVALALADGIGGLKRGAECAATALGSFLAGIHREAQAGAEPAEWLMHSALRANERVHRELIGEGGATLVAALLMNGQPHRWLSVGDSRIHTCRGVELTQISRDDTIAGQLGKPGKLGFDSTSLLQFIGFGPQLEPHIGMLEGPVGGVLALTSDGVHFLPPEWLGGIIGHADDLGTCARRLVEGSKWFGGPDNATAAVIALPGPQLALQGWGRDLSFEVWDPFGELQLLDAPAAMPPAQAVREPEPERCSPSPFAEKASKSRGEPKASGDGAKERRSRPRKPKAGSRTAQVKSGEEKADAPQLIIDFPKKVQ